MKRFAQTIAALLTLACAVPVWGSFIIGGDAGEVSPADPAMWTNSTDGYVGLTSGETGSITVDSGSDLLSKCGYLGSNAGSTGTVTVTGAGSTWANSSVMYVGNSGTGTLNVDSGGQVSNTDAYIGGNSGSSGTVAVSGSGSQWSAWKMYVGNSGGAIVSVTGGGRITDSFSYLGYNAGSTGTATVSGAGSTWTDTGGMYVGYSGTGSLTIADGGKLTNNNYTVYLGYNSSGTGQVNLSGAGASWTSVSMEVGLYGGGSLRISDGAKMACTGPYVKSYIGHYFGSCGDVTVTGTDSSWVTGAESSWPNQCDVYVGYEGNGSLTLSNGGKVIASTHAYFGYRSGATGTLIVTGAGSSWTNGGDLWIGLGGTGSLTVNDGGTVTAKTLWAAGSDLKGNGTLNVGGIVSDVSFVFDAMHGSNAVSSFGTGGTLNLNLNYANNLGVGYRGAASITVCEGAKIHCAEGYLGYYAGASGMATLTGAGSTWSPSSLYVGYYGTGALQVDSGAKLDAGSNTVYFGYNAGSSGAAIVTGAGTTWTANNSYDLQIGYRGQGELRVGDGASLRSYITCIGYYSGAVGSLAVTDTGSVWNNYGELYVGYSSTGNVTLQSGALANVTGDMFVGYSSGSVGTLTICGGATVSSRLSSIGRQSSSRGSVTVIGSGTTWTITGFLGVGEYGSGSLLVADGASVSSSATSYIGSDATGSVTVTGPGSTWTSGGDVYVGYNGTGSLTVLNGGVASVKTLWAPRESLKGDSTINATGIVSDYDLVFDPLHQNTQVLPFGTWGALTLRLDETSVVGAGYHGTGSITVTGGAKITTSLGYLGYGTGSTGIGSVTGAGSTWTTSGTLRVGYDGAGSLVVADGGKVVSEYSYIGYDAGSSGSVTVRGAGSSWTNNSDFSVGWSGAGTLMVSEGGLVTCDRGQIAWYSSGSSGLVIVTGAGSTWKVTAVSVGFLGSGALTVSDGGKVINTGGGSIGYSAGSSGTVVVTGANSSWTNSGDLEIGKSGSGSLTVDSGGVVSANTLWAAGSNLKGNGTINVKGIVSDIDLTFDAAHEANPVSTFGTGGTLNLSLNSACDLGVGYSGGASLQIVDGVKVQSAHGYVGYNAGANGTASVTGAGSTWTIGQFMQIGNNGTGVLKIADGGVVAISSSVQIGSSGTGIVTVSGVGSTFSAGGVTVGGSGFGSLTVSDGGSVTCRNTYIKGGYSSGSGTALVTGAGSTWTTNYTFYVGQDTAGTLRVEHGGKVSSKDGYITYNNNSTGTVIISGAGSAWTNTGSLTIGNPGLGSCKGSLTLADGGVATAKSLTVGWSGVLNLRVSGSGMLVLGDATTAGTVYNRNKINLYADAFLAADTYSPISEYSGRSMTWTGTGTCNAWGGTWEAVANTLTVAEATPVAAGAVDSVSTGERLLITNPADGQRLGASFATVSAGTTFSASPFGESQLGDLVLAPGQFVLSAWDITTNITGGTALLAFDVGLNRNGLEMWKYGGGSWSRFAANDLVYDANGVASFTATDLDGYALVENPIIAHWQHDPSSVGEWQDLANWSTGTPNAQVAAYVKNAGTATVSTGAAVAGRLFVGSGGDGSLAISGGSLTLGSMILGELAADSGAAVHSGGTAAVSGDITLGKATDSTGTYNLGGTGSLSAGNLYVGDLGNGAFTQTGGAAVIGGETNIGKSDGSNGAMTLGGGSFTTRDFKVGVGGDASLAITNAAAVVTVTNKLSFGPSATFTAAPGSTIHMTGSNFENTSTNPAGMAGLANLALVFEGGPAVTDTIEVGGKNLGPHHQGFEDNFAMGTLQFGSASDVGKGQLVDAFDNQQDGASNEVLYVDRLVVGEGSTLDLAGRKVYYHSLVNQGTISGGTLQRVSTATLKVWLEADCVTSGDYGVRVWAQVVDGELNEGILKLYFTISSSDTTGVTVPKSVGVVNKTVKTVWGDALSGMSRSNAGLRDTDGDGDIDAYNAAFLNDIALTLGSAPVLLATETWTMLQNHPAYLMLSVSNAQQFDATGSATALDFDLLDVAGVTVPEPATLALLAMGAAAMLRRRR